MPVAKARSIAPVAESLLEVLADLDEDGALENVYNIDEESDHDDVEASSVPPLEAALYQWRRSGYPITVAQAPPPGAGWDEPEHRAGRGLRQPGNADGRPGQPR